MGRKESFEEFLKKHQSEAEWNKYYIPTRKLGEWAWESFKEWILSTPKEYHKETINSVIERSQWLGELDLPFKIAISCLGKIEIEKRLKELK